PLRGPVVRGGRRRRRHRPRHRRTGRDRHRRMRAVHRDDARAPRPRRRLRLAEIHHPPEPWTLSARGGFIGLTGSCDGTVALGGDTAPPCAELAAVLDTTGTLHWFHATQSACVQVYGISVDPQGGAALMYGWGTDLCVDLGGSHPLTGDAFLVRL